MKLCTSLLWFLLLTFQACFAATPGKTSYTRTRTRHPVNSRPGSASFYRQIMTRSRACAGTRIVCPEHHYCLQIAGRYMCRAYSTNTYRPQVQISRNLQVAKDEDCNEGYKRIVLEDQTYDQCKDIDECSQDSTLCGTRRERCQNYPGKYKCYCNSGFEFNGTTCVDKNECEGTRKFCAHICTNTEGAYSCSCREGFKKRNYRYYVHCTDIDECLYGTHNCKDTEYCLNLSGGYECVVPPDCPENYVRVAALKSTCVHDGVSVLATGEPNNIRYRLMPTLTNTTGFVGSITMSIHGFNVTTSVRTSNNKIGYETNFRRSSYGSGRITTKFSTLEPLSEKDEGYLIIDLITNIYQPNGQLEHFIDRIELTVFGYNSYE